MALDEQTYALIDRYLLGAMDANERMAFEERMSAEADLNDEVAWMKQLQQEMKNMGRDVLKRQLAAIGAAVPTKELASYSPSQNAIAPPKTSSFNWWWILIVAGAIGTAIFWYVKETSGDHESRIFQPSDPNRAPEFISSGEIQQGKLTDSAKDTDAIEKQEAYSEECPVLLLTVKKALAYTTSNELIYEHNSDGDEQRTIKVIKNDTVREKADLKNATDATKQVLDTRYEKQVQVKLDGSKIAVYFCPKGNDAATLSTRGIDIVQYRFDGASLYLNSAITEKSGLALRDAGDGKHLWLELPTGITYQIKNDGSGVAQRLSATAK
jgi:hypothetical protein